MPNPTESEKKPCPRAAAHTSGVILEKSGLNRYFRPYCYGYYREEEHRHHDFSEFFYALVYASEDDKGGKQHEDRVPEKRSPGGGDESAEYCPELFPRRSLRKGECAGLEEVFQGPAADDAVV